MRMTNRRKANEVLWLESLGFLAIIILSWLDELIQLPRLFWGGSAQSNWRESVTETAVTVIVWAVVFAATKKVLRRFHYLEDQLRMCAWCRKLDAGGKWVSIEDYCQRELGVNTTHGICPNCGRDRLPDFAPMRPG